MATHQESGNDPVQNSVSPNAESGMRSTSTNEETDSTITQPAMVNFNGYSLPKAVYEDIKKTSAQIAARKLEKEWQEQNRIRSQEEASQTQTQFQELEALRRKLDQRDQDYQALEQRSKELEKSIRQERIYQSLSQAALEQDANPISMHDFMERILRDNRIHLDEDLQTIHVLDGKGNKCYNQQGMPLGLHDVVHEYKEITPYYFKPSENAGAGGFYQNSTSATQDVGVPHLKRAQPVIMKTVSQTSNQGGA